MSGTIEAKLAALGVTLPLAPPPAATYVPFVQVGDLVHVSGQISNGPDGLIKGRLGADMSVEAGAAAAKTCAISLLAQVKAACGGDLDRLVRVVKLVGFVASDPAFTDQPKVINGASDFLVIGRSAYPHILKYHFNMQLSAALDVILSPGGVA